MNKHNWWLCPIAVTLWLTFIPSVSSSANLSQQRVLIINSDRSNQIYASIHQAFKSELNVKQIDELDLARTSNRTVRRTLSRSRSDIVYAIGAKAYWQVAKLINNQPLIFSTIQWRQFNRRYNTYNIPIALPAETQLFMYQHLFPQIRTIGILYSDNNRDWFHETKSTAAQIGITLHGRQINDQDDISYALRQLFTRVQAFWLITDPIVFANANQILKVADSWQKPLFANETLFSRYGAVLTLAADTLAVGRHAASLATLILERQTVSEPIQFPTSSQVTLNLTKARQYRMTVNQAALSSVDKQMR